MLVALTGGTMNNAALSKGSSTGSPPEASREGSRGAFPPGDGGLSLGQAWWARTAKAAGADQYAFADAGVVLGRELKE